MNQDKTPTSSPPTQEEIEKVARQMIGAEGIGEFENFHDFYQSQALRDARFHLEQTAQLRAEIAELRKDKERLDWWFEECRKTTYGYYDRQFLDAAMKGPQ